MQRETIPKSSEEFTIILLNSRTISDIVIVNKCRKPDRYVCRAFCVVSEFPRIEGLRSGRRVVM